MDEGSARIHVEERAGPVGLAHPVPTGSAALGAALTALAGFTDAVGFAGLGSLYLSFMSGNSTHLGMWIAAADWSAVWLACTVVMTFVAGAALGTHIADRSGRLWPVLAVELLIVGHAIVLSIHADVRLALVPVAGAMGMQNTLHQIVAGADVGKSFLTGNLFGLGQALARMVGDRAQARRAAQHALSWLAFIAGVVAGAVSYATLGVTAALAVIALAIPGLIIAARSIRQAP
jgi:uncharacterized membrane protein YoaK (UPF0700 family)